MVYVNGPHPIIILEFGEELLSNNSNICVIQSNWRWDLAAIEDLRRQATPGVQVLYLHNGTRDAETRTDDKDAQREPTNDLPVTKSATKKCNYTCKHWAEKWSSNICWPCKRNPVRVTKGDEDHYLEAKDE